MGFLFFWDALYKEESSGFCKLVVILYPSFTNFLNNILDIQYAELVVDNTCYIMSGNL